jgi:hypothetical protein
MSSSLSLDRQVYEISAGSASVSGQKINRTCKGLIEWSLWSKCAAMCTGLSTETGDNLGNSENRYERGGCGRSPWQTKMRVVNSIGHINEAVAMVRNNGCIGTRTRE